MLALETAVETYEAYFQSIARIRKPYKHSNHATELSSKAHVLCNNHYVSSSHYMKPGTLGRTRDVINLVDNSRMNYLPRSQGRNIFVSEAIEQKRMS